MKKTFNVKFITCLLAILFVITTILGGCGASNSGDAKQATDAKPAADTQKADDTKQPADTKQTADKGKKEVVIGWNMAYFDHPVYQLLMKGAKEVAEKEGVKLIFADGKNDAATQASIVDNFIAQKVDAIILTPTVADPLIPSVKKINQAGIPLVIADRRMFKQGQDIKWDALVSWDMVKSGTYGGEQVVQALNGKGNVVVVEGTPGAGPTIDRGNAFYEVLKKSPDIKVVYKVSGDFKRDKGMEVTENILQRFPKGKIDAIYYMNDEMALGGLQAIKAAGRLHDFKIISVDGEKEALDALRAGDIDYEAMFFPDDQAVAVSIAASLAKGEKPDLANQTYKGKKMELTEFEGMPWVRPTVFKVDKTNANQPEYAGW